MHLIIRKNKLELLRNIDNYEKAKKEKVLELSKEGQVISKSSDIVKQPYVFKLL